jgi:SAM-dependent methyltransferase
VLAERAAHVHALDVSAEMVRRARELSPDLANVSWLVGNGTDLAPIADSSADGVVSHVVFQHIPDPAVTVGYVREMGRVLRPGGWAAFQLSNDPTVHRPAPRGPAARVRELLHRAPRGQREAPWLGAAVDLGDLRAAAAAAGLSVERVSGEGTQFCVVRLAAARR